MQIPKKSLQKGAFFSNATALQSRISDISKCRLQEKCFFWVFWNSWKFPRERTYTEVIWLTKCFWKNLFTHFWENVGKIAVMKVLENYQKRVFNSVHFKNTGAVQSTHLQLCRKLIPPPGFPLFVLRNFKTAGRASAVESHFS